MHRHFLGAVLSPIIVFLALSACASEGRDRTDDAAAPQEGRTTSEPRPSSGDATRDADPANGIAAAGGGVDDNAALGSAGDELLSPAIPQVVIEIDRSPGAGLAVDPRSVLAEELREHGGKTQVHAGADSAVPAQRVYSASDLRAITAAARGSHSQPGRPAIYVLILEGRYEDQRVTGLAFAATAFAVFPEQIGSTALGLNRGAYETAVLVHELGHLFGLVDLTGKGDFHEDPDHPGHSRYESSVMYWAVEDISIANVFRGGPPREFDEADRREMQRIRAS